MLKKPEKWGLKFWCRADSGSKYLYRFEVYYARSNQTINNNRRHAHGEAKKVVIDLVESIHNMEHVIVMDNFFSSIDLFMAFGGAWDLCNRHHPLQLHWIAFMFERHKHSIEILKVH